MARPKKWWRRGLYTLLIVFCTINVISAFHAYKFTHFSRTGTKTVESYDLSFWNKAGLLFTGIDNPRPVNRILPAHPFETIDITSNVKIECWKIRTDSAPKGTVILLHGYTSCKSMMLDRAEVLLKHGYNCLLVDFMGSGGSGGNETAIGFKEAEEVRDCYEYLDKSGEKNIYLYGSSMGAAAIMKAVKDYRINPRGIIIDCPFGTMYETVCVRFRNLHVPPVPLASVLLFWGSIENGFWGFAHNPVDYAKSIRCPTLLEYGEKDDRVTRGEVDRIYANLNCPKRLAIYPEAGHDDYLKKAGEAWSATVIGFLDGINGK